MFFLEPSLERLFGDILRFWAHFSPKLWIFDHPGRPAWDQNGTKIGPNPAKMVQGNPGLCALWAPPGAPEAIQGPPDLILDGFGMDFGRFLDHFWNSFAHFRSIFGGKPVENRRHPFLHKVPLPQGPERNLAAGKLDKPI